MNEVYAIKDKEQLKKFCDYLEKYCYKYFVIFSIGMYSGLRVSDILSLKITNVKDKKAITLIEKKTHKRKTFPIKQELAEILKEYLKYRATIWGYDDSLLFIGKKRKKLDKSACYRAFNEAAKAVGITTNIGTHTMRKTFGYWHYKQFNDIVMLQKIFNHSSPNITLRYIGIEQEEINASYEAFSYWNDNNPSPEPPERANLGYLFVNEIERLKEENAVKEELIAKLIKEKNRKAKAKAKHKKQVNDNVVNIEVYLKNYIKNGGIRHRDFAIDLLDEIKGN